MLFEIKEKKTQIRALNLQNCDYQRRRGEKKKKKRGRRKGGRKRKKKGIPVGAQRLKPHISSLSGVFFSWLEICISHL